MGGLMKRMPWTATAMMVGAVAIAALPPLNGFTSKWLIYLSLMNCGLSPSADHGLTAFLAVGLLALVGGLAAIAFVRLTGIALLGSPRSDATAHAHESSWWMRAPILLLVFLCLAMALAPYLGLDFLSESLKHILRRQGQVGLDALAQPADSLFTLGALNAWILTAVGLSAFVFFMLTRKAGSVEGPTWGCGYVQPTRRMQYTGRAFAEILAEHVLPRFLRPRKKRKAPEGLFPVAGEFASQSPDPFAEKVYEPFFARWARRCAQLRILQQGKVSLYLLYILLTVIMAFAWVSLRIWLRAAG
jgi:hydrogenase-4 component B